MISIKFTTDLPPQEMKAKLKAILGFQKVYRDGDRLNLGSSNNWWLRVIEESVYQIEYRCEHKHQKEEVWFPFLEKLLKVFECYTCRVCKAETQSETHYYCEECSTLKKLVKKYPDRTRAFLREVI